MTTSAGFLNPVGSDVASGVPGFHEPPRFLGFFGKRFSHFRKQLAEFVRVDDGTTYSLENRAADPLCHGKFAAVLASITKEKPATTAFADVDAAKQFVFDLDGSCGYSYERGLLSFQ